MCYNYREYLERAMAFTLIDYGPGKRFPSTTAVSVVHSSRILYNARSHAFFKPLRRLPNYTIRELTIQ